jgi:hypothetical protein
MTMQHSDEHTRPRTQVETDIAISPAAAAQPVSDASLDESTQSASASEEREGKDAATQSVRQLREIGGRDGPEPTRFGDWERAGRCIDF